jgi:hypothetical protein
VLEETAACIFCHGVVWVFTKSLDYRQIIGSSDDGQDLKSSANHHWVVTFEGTQGDASSPFVK